MRAMISSSAVKERRPLFQRITRAVGPRGMLRAIGLYPPFLGAGIRVVAVDPELRDVTVEMPLRRWNQNYLGTQFGGSLYSMTDPFYVILLLAALGPGHAVWDKEASIAFLRPGRGTVRARFTLDDVALAAIRADLARDGKSYPRFTVDITAAGGEVVARVSKLVSVRTAEALP